ncbi:putative membrane protein, partial [Bacteroides fragilis str. 3986 T(B)9]
MKFIYSILLALLWVGITITLGSYLYRMGLPVVNASAQ